VIKGSCQSEAFAIRSQRSELSVTMLIPSRIVKTRPLRIDLLYLDARSINRRADIRIADSLFSAAHIMIITL
jgi:hypothetical protein